MAFDLRMGEQLGNYDRVFGRLKELGRHLQGFVMVYDPKGKPLYFRYYDPRVFAFIFQPAANRSSGSSLDRSTPFTRKERTPLT